MIIQQYSSAPSSAVSLSTVSVTHSQPRSLKQMILLLTYDLKVNSSLTLRHTAYIIHLTSLITYAFYHLT